MNFQNIIKIVNKNSNMSKKSESETEEQKQNHKQFKSDTEEYVYSIKTVRARPLTSREEEKAPLTVIKILNKQLVLVQDLGHHGPEDAFRGFRPKGKPYAFDYAFDEDSNQQEVYESTTKFLIEGLLEGFHATVFCYGATGAGKTYTMLGTSENPGIMFQAIQDLVDGVQKPSSYQYALRMWYVEVYNEVLKDLLTPGKGGRLEIREDAIKGVTLAGAKEVMVTNTEDVMDLLKFGNKNRTKESTWANEASSRSHAVLQVTVERKDKLEAIDSDMVVAKLTLIDLAGSERASVTKNKGLRLIEGANINRSLLALANCINALANNQSIRTTKESHIPYRDSKLTRLLKETLGGKCRTTMIANVSPSIMCYEDTLNTLKYADRAKQIKTTVSRNILNVKTHINNYQEVITQLKAEVGVLRKQLDQAKDKRVERILSDPSPKKPERAVKLYYPSEKLRQIEYKLKLHFEKEIKAKKKILEIEQESQKLGFDLFDLQLQLAKVKRGETGQMDPSQITKAIEGIRRQIETCGRKMKAHLQTLAGLEQNREPLMDEIKQEMLNTSIDHEAFKFLLKSQMNDSLQVDYERNNMYALFLLKQRENYIKYLRTELSKSPNNSRYGIDTETEEEKNLSTMLKIEEEFKASKRHSSLLPDIHKGSHGDNFIFLNEGSTLPSPLANQKVVNPIHHLPLIKRGNAKSKFSLISTFLLEKHN